MTTPNPAPGPLCPYPDAYHIRPKSDSKPLRGPVCIGHKPWGGVGDGIHLGVHLCSVQVCEGRVRLGGGSGPTTKGMGAKRHLALAHERGI